MSEQTPKNSLAYGSMVPPPLGAVPTNALRGGREDIKAYLGLMGFDPSTMTEGMLSPRAVAEMRETIAKTLGKPRDGGWEIINEYPDADPRNTPPGHTHMKHVTGRVHSDNLRQVDVGGVPYYQLLDKYDFDAGAKYDGTWLSAVLGGVKDFADAPLDMVGLGEGGGYLNYPYEAERFAGKHNLSRNINYLIPVDPNRVAPPELLEAYRKKTTLPYPSQTLGPKAVNHLMNPVPGQYEKVQP